MLELTVKKGDTVFVLAGRDKGKRGIVERVLPQEGKLVVTGVSLIKRHLKKTQARPQGGIIEKPAPLPRGKVMPVCPHCDKPTRVRHTKGEAGSYRACQHCNGSLDTK